ncbi:hypothetical protein CDL15_Pgr000070 [Punica granatum]|uniref:Uncharacterized protein n=1 Tax=Punica granatum TaxID=22663 RepID=A0A218VPW1_PUNGR|nr:hypothetical protein CDL15_Pgr000070 [Punica granatum]
MIPIEKEEFTADPKLATRLNHLTLSHSHRRASAQLVPNEDPSNASIRRKREVRKALSLSLPDKESIHGIISPILSKRKRSIKGKNRVKVSQVQKTFF